MNSLESVKITHYSYRYIYVIYDTPKLPLENLLIFESQNRFMTQQLDSNTVHYLIIKHFVFLH